jgi:hypothetical protein
VLDPQLKLGFKFQAMDPALVGSLIGMGILACLGLVVVIQDKGNACVESVKRKIARWKLQRQPLLPVEIRNPVLVRVPSAQWRVKQLLELK